jgi:hypothetical protein
VNDPEIQVMAVPEADDKLNPDEFGCRGASSPAHPGEDYQWTLDYEAAPFPGNVGNDTARASMPMSVQPQPQPQPQTLFDVFHPQPWTTTAAISTVSGQPDVSFGNDTLPAVPALLMFDVGQLPGAPLSMPFNGGSADGLSSTDLLPDFAGAHAGTLMNGKCLTNCCKSHHG